MPVQFNKCYLSLQLLPAFLILCFATQHGNASPGDRNLIYLQCLHYRSSENCFNASSLKKFENVRPWYLSALSWECFDECKYHCMWDTVELLQERGYPIPQFHGKWPFIRIYGIQEPASALFSILNGVSHFLMWIKFKKAVFNYPRSIIWDFQALLSVNAWFWSTIYHTRDTPVTEKLDYFCAFSLVLFSFYSLLIKLFSKFWSLLPYTLGVPFVSVFAYHVYYLTFVKFDYGYNLAANVIVGVMNSIGWIIWCFLNRQKRYIWKCCVSVVCINLLLLLELWDFPPWLYLIDAHALWHLGTIPVPILWYSFLIDDCLETKKKS